MLARRWNQQRMRIEVAKADPIAHEPWGAVGGDRGRQTHAAGDHAAKELGPANLGLLVAHGQVEQVLSAVGVDAPGDEQGLLGALTTQRLERRVTEEVLDGDSERSRATKTWSSSHSRSVISGTADLEINSSPVASRKASRDSILTTLTHRLGIEGAALVTAKEASLPPMTSVRRRGSSALCSPSSSPARSPPHSSGCTCGPGGDPPRKQPVNTSGARHGSSWSWPYGAAGRVAGIARQRSAVRRVRRGIAGRRLRAVVVHRLVHAHGPGEMAGPDPYGRDHGRRDGGYTLSATLWMPQTVTRNETQFGFFGWRSPW